MKAVVLKKDGNIHYMDVPKPVPGKGEVLVRIRACGICGSDLGSYKGTFAYFEPPWEESCGYCVQDMQNL